MSRITSDYLAYIFRNTSEMVPVTAETNHCENYLKILLLRYRENSPIILRFMKRWKTQ